MFSFPLDTPFSPVFAFVSTLGFPFFAFFSRFGSFPRFSRGATIFLGQSSNTSLGVLGLSPLTQNTLRERISRDQSRSLELDGLLEISFKSLVMIGRNYNHLRMLRMIERCRVFSPFQARRFIGQVEAVRRVSPFLVFQPILLSTPLSEDKSIVLHI